MKSTPHTSCTHTTRTALIAEVEEAEDDDEEDDNEDDDDEDDDEEECALCDCGVFWFSWSRHDTNCESLLRVRVQVFESNARRVGRYTTFA